MRQDNTQEVMIGLGTFENRVVHSTKKHPQIGSIHFEGRRRKVFIGFWGDCPVWKLADDGEDVEYAYCAEKTMPIDDDPDYCGDESGIEVTVVQLNSETVVG